MISSKWSFKVNVLNSNCNWKRKVVFFLVMNKHLTIFMFDMFWFSCISFAYTETYVANFLKRVCVCVQSYLTLCDPMDYSLPGSSVHGILQVRILEWVAISSSRGSSWSPGHRGHQGMDPMSPSGSCISRKILYHWTTWEASYINPITLGGMLFGKALKIKRLPRHTNWAWFKLLQKLLIFFSKL